MKTAEVEQTGKKLLQVYNLLFNCQGLSFFF